MAGENQLEKIGKATGIIPEPSLQQKAGDAFGAAKDWVGGLLNGVKSLPSAGGAAMNQQNKDAWLKQPTVEQLAYYNSVKETPEYKEVSSALGALNGVMAASTIGVNTPDGAGVNHIAGVIHKHTADLTNTGGQLMAGAGELASQVAKVAPSAMGGIADSAGQTWNKLQASFQKDGFQGAVSSLGNSFMQGVSGAGIFLSGVLNIDATKKNILDDRIGLIGADLKTQGFSDDFIKLVTDGALATGIEKAGLKEYIKKQEQVSPDDAKSVAKTTISENVGKLAQGAAPQNVTPTNPEAPKVPTVENVKPIVKQVAAK